MRVRVLYFAAAREAAGLGEESVDVPEGADVARLRDLLALRHPGLEPLAPSLRFARGDRFVGEGTPLAEGDTVVLLPPMSGG